MAAKQQPDDERQQLERTLLHHCREIAQLALFPEDPFAGELEIQDSQVAAVAKSPLAALLLDFASNHKPDSRFSAGFMMSLLVRFFAANAMSHRYTLADSVRANRVKDSSRGEAEVRYLRSLRLWNSPDLSVGGTLGSNSLHRLDKSQIADVATEFFKTGIRCIWFERMLIESIVAGEVYALKEALKSDATLATGRTSMLWNIFVAVAYHSSNGASPKYDIYVWLARIFHVAIAIAVVAGMAFYSQSLVESNKLVRGYLLAIIAGVLAIGLVGRFITSTIVRWVKAASGDAINATLGFRMHSLAHRAELAWSQICHANMNPTLVRELLTQCVEHGFVIDPITFAYLDRAAAKNEFRWSGLYDLPPALDY